jgi:SAM-dependent methyltransferase
VTRDVEQRLVFGEVAEQYDRYRPGYPDELFDAVVAYADARAGDRALEVGAGTGIATRAMTARGLTVTALEPSPGMAAFLRGSGVEVVETTLEDWSVEPAAFGLVYGAQSWHWVTLPQGYDVAAAALAPGGAIALFWNVPTEWDGQLGDDIDGVYRQHAPHLVRASEQWDLDGTLRELDDTGHFVAIEKRTFPWTETYTTETYRAILATHSNHRMLEDDQRERLHGAVADVVERHGGTVDVEYTAWLYLARRA